MPVGQLIDRTWEYYREHLVELLSVSGWMLATGILNVIALALYPNATKLVTGAHLTAPEILGTVLFFVTSTIIVPVVGLWVLCALTRRMSGGSTKEGWKYFWPAAILSVLLQLIMLGGILLGLAPSFVFLVLAWLTQIDSLFILGNFLLLVGVYVATFLAARWFVLYVMAPYALLIDNVHGKAALKSARELIRGRFWSFLMRYALPKLFFLVVGIILMTIMQYIAGIMISTVAGLNLDVVLRLISITSTVIPILLAALLTPLIVISDVLLYNNLKGR